MPVKSGNDTDFVTQDEIDRLLSQADESTDAASDAPDDAEATDFITQGEIDRLLSQADESTDAASDAPDDAEAKEETAAETEVDVKDSDASTDDETPEEVSLEDFDDLVEDEPAVNETADRVILEEVPEAPKKEKSQATSIWPLHKDFWITLSAVFFLGTALNGSLWMFNKRSLQIIAPEVRSFPVVNTAIAEAPTTFRMSPRAVTLKGFLIPAPVERKDLTYITADVSIELTHSKAVSLVKAHAPFYRNIIYDVIKNVLGALDKSKISEISLKMEILKALNGSVPERSVRDVIVDTFVMF
jgi:flagellar basal body-associated protein FliL